MKDIQAADAVRVYTELLQREIELNPGVEPAETAYKLTFTNVIGPLFHHQMLGITEHNALVIGEFAEKAAQAAHGETAAYYNNNPLASLDLPLMRAEGELLEQEMNRNVIGNLHQARWARQALRQIEQGVKTKVREYGEDSGVYLDESAEEILMGRVYANLPPDALRDGLWNWEIRSLDRHRTINELMRLLGIEEPISKLQKENPEWKEEGVVVSSLPTHGTGIWASVDIRSQRHADDWAGLYLGLEQSAALAILQHPSLPRLIRALPS